MCTLSSLTVVHELEVSSSCHHHFLMRLLRRSRSIPGQLPDWSQALGSFVTTIGVVDVRDASSIVRFDSIYNIRQAEPLAAVSENLQIAFYVTLFSLDFM
jgi:hypothetical protein